MQFTEHSASRLSDSDVDAVESAASSLPTPPPDLRSSKHRFLDAAKRVDFLSPVKEHPYIAVGAAAALGVVAASPALTRVASAAFGSTILRQIAKFGAAYAAKKMQNSAVADATANAPPIPSPS